VYGDKVKFKELTGIQVLDDAEIKLQQEQQQKEQQQQLQQLEMMEEAKQQKLNLDSVAEGGPTPTDDTLNTAQQVNIVKQMVNQIQSDEIKQLETGIETESVQLVNAIDGSEKQIIIEVKPEIIRAT
jgi:hypothetical protein